MKKFEFGPIQTEWLQSLRENAHRQASGYLMTTKSLKEDPTKDYTACCLGELCIIYYKHHQLSLTFNYGDKLEVGGLRSKSVARIPNYKDYGLYGDLGDFYKEFDSISIRVKKSYYNMGKKRQIEYGSLAAMNDDGVTWPEIADFIEDNPTLVFSKTI